MKPWILNLMGMTGALAAHVMFIYLKSDGSGIYRLQEINYFGVLSTIARFLVSALFFICPISWYREQMRMRRGHTRMSTSRGHSSAQFEKLAYSRKLPPSNTGGTYVDSSFGDYLLNHLQLRCHRSLLHNRQGHSQ